VDDSGDIDVVKIFLTFAHCQDILDT